MAAPEYVPTAPLAGKHYTSPPQRTRAWSASRPGEVIGAQAGSDPARLGAPGPDQGYAMSLTSIFDSKLHLTDDEHRGDVDAGAIEVALKRASLFGRAPVVHDLRVAYQIFGFLDPSPPAELVELRKKLFAEVHYSFHYFERRAIVDAVPESLLRSTPDAVASAYAQDWRSCIAFGE